MYCRPYLQSFNLLTKD